MSDSVLTTLITAVVTLLGTILTVVTTAISNRKKTIGKIDTVEQKLDSHIKEEEWANAKQCRIRILRFNDEICRGTNFSENHYEDILEDIDSYEKFCNTHKDYHNGKGQIAMENIRAAYKQHMLDRNFLK